MANEGNNLQQIKLKLMVEGNSEDKKNNSNWRERKIIGIIPGGLIHTY